MEFHPSTTRERATRAWLFASIAFKSRVQIVTPHGQTVSGWAVMRGPAGWVLNLGGAHGTPGIATPENVVSVKAPRVTRTRKDV